VVFRNEDRESTILISERKPQYGYIEEDILVLHFVLYMKKHSPMNRIFKTKIDQMIQGGIVQYLQKDLGDKSITFEKGLKEEENLEDPTQLTIEHLELCFYAILIGLALSCVVFLYELLIGFLSSM
jgi:hypothetical protein